MYPDATTVEQSLLAVALLITPSIVTSLKAELPEYIARATDASANFLALDWWQLNGDALPNWACAAKKILLLQYSSATLERVFSLLKCLFGEQQDNSLQDYMETS